MDERRGERAKALLADELLIESFDKARAFYLSAYESSSEGDTVVRERAYHRLRALQDVKAHLESLAVSGVIEKRKRWGVL